jgi:hypothetical protein
MVMHSRERILSVIPSQENVQICATVDSLEQSSVGGV